MPGGIGHIRITLYGGHVQMHLKLAGAVAATAAVGAVVAFWPGQAALAAPASSAYVPCSASALATALSAVSSGETLFLVGKCTYHLVAALPDITTNLTIVGNGATLERSYAGGTPDFTILTVDGGESSGDLTLFDVNFRNGGGGSDYYGGAIYNDGDVTVHGGSFADNYSGEYGGAIYSDGYL